MSDLFLRMLPFGGSSSSINLWTTDYVKVDIEGRVVGLILKYGAVCVEKYITVL